MRDVGPCTEVRSLNRNRDFLALWTGQTLSALGTSVSSLAYPLLVLSMTGSAGLTGLTASIQLATTFLLRMPAGVLVDRWNRRLVMLTCDAGRALALASVAVAFYLNRLTLVHVFLVVVVEGALGVLFRPAEAVAVRAVVAPSQVGDAIARNEARSQLAGLLGPPAGGALFGWSRGLPFVADALSYLLSFLSVASVRTPLPVGDRSPEHGKPLRGIFDGARWLLRQRFLRSVVLWQAFAGVLFTSIGLITLLRAEEIGATPAEIGVMFALTGVGGFAGALVAPRLGRMVRPGLLVIAFGWTSAGATLGLLAARSPYVLGGLGAVAFFLVPTVNALILSRIAVSVPDRLHGRTVSAAVQLTTLLHPVGPALAGLSVERLGAQSTITVYGAAFAVTALVATLSRPIRRERVLA